MNVQTSQSAPSSRLYFNSIYLEEKKKCENFLNKEQYLRYLKILLEVHEECGVEYLKGLSRQQNFRELRKYTLLKPPSTPYELMTRVKDLSVNLLFAAEAAGRMDELKESVKIMLKAWHSEIFFPVTGKEIRPDFIHDPLIPTVDRVIRGLKCRNAELSEIWLPHLSDFTLSEMRSCLTNLEMLIFREALNKPFSDDEVIAYLKKNSDEKQYRHCAVILHLYGNRRSFFSFKENRFEKVSEVFVKLCLSMMKNLQFLDLSDCKGLTSQCLKEGHENLQTLVLDGTGIRPEDIDRTKFPALKTVTKNLKYRASEMETCKPNRDCSMCTIS